MGGVNGHLISNTLPPDSGNSQRAKLLQSVLRETAVSLQSTPRQLKLYKALHGKWQPNMM
jgi:hypothetical protein